MAARTFITGSAMPRRSTSSNNRNRPNRSPSSSRSFFFSSRRRHTYLVSDWSSDVCSSDLEAVLSRYRHEVALKALWLPTVETQLECDAILYPYWPSPPRRHVGALPAVMCVYDLAYRLRPAEVPWQQRAYMGAVMGPALRQAAAVLVISKTTRDDLLSCYPIPGLERK